jgi:decaprenylphospho-beta-D-erythro-pentofuranosid-2-ulose 2-reductase
MPCILVLGATSAIATALARQFAQNGFILHLAGRNTSELDRICQDMMIRYKIKCTSSYFEALDYKSHSKFLDLVIHEVGKLDGAIVAFGNMDYEYESHDNFHLAHNIIQSNFSGAVSILTVIACHLKSQKSGFIVTISSVAGDRGRQSNYVYGSAKGGLTIFTQGLRNHLYKSGVTLLTVKLGFVDTNMTFGKDKLFLVASPQKIANSIYKQHTLSKTIYEPSFWKYILFIIKLIPEFIFIRMSF